MFMIRSKTTFPLSNLPLKNLNQLHFSGKWCLIMLDLSFPMGSMALWFFLICYLFVLGQIRCAISFILSLLAYVVLQYWNFLIDRENQLKEASKKFTYQFWLLDWLICKGDEFIVIWTIQENPLLFKVKDCASLDKSGNIILGWLDKSDLTLLVNLNT
jgi:hypothetical protein